jgi:hypothetical protein
MGLIDRVTFTAQQQDVAALLDQCIYQARPHAAGVPLWQSLVQAVAAGGAEEVRRQAQEVLVQPSRHLPDGRTRHGRLLGCSEGSVELEIADHELVAGFTQPFRRHRRVRLRRSEPGYVQAEVVIDDRDSFKTPDFARLLCALHWEYGGFTECLIDGVDALPNMGLAVLCLRVEGYEDLARQALERHQRWEHAAEAGAANTGAGPQSLPEVPTVFVAASGRMAEGGRAVAIELRRGADPIRLLLAAAEAGRLLAGVAAAVAGLLAADDAGGS